MKRIGAVVAATALIGVAFAIAGTSVQAATLPRFTTVVNGATEVPPVSSNVTGTATITVNVDSVAVCLNINALVIPSGQTITTVGLYNAEAGHNGPRVVDFGNDTSSNCIQPDDPGVPDDIVASPNQYYVSVRTNLFTEGAARGQLPAGGTTVEVADPPTGGTSGSTQATTVSTAAGCNPNYSGVCIPPNLSASQVNCSAGVNVVVIVTRPVTVVGVDVLGLDGDNDGIGCEDNSTASSTGSTPRFTG